MAPSDHWGAPSNQVNPLFCSKRMFVVFPSPLVGGGLPLRLPQRMPADEFGDVGLAACGVFVCLEGGA
jgi:hypothetical protein